MNLNDWKRMPTVTSAEVPPSQEVIEVDFSFEDWLPEAEATVAWTAHRPQRTIDWNENDNCVVVAEAPSISMLDVA